MKQLLIILFLILSFNTLAQKQSELYLAEGTVTFPNIRVYLLAPVFYEPFGIDLSVEDLMHQDYYLIEDSAYIQSTEVNKLFTSGFFYDGYSPITVTVKRQHEVSLDRTTSYGLSQPYPLIETLYTVKSDATGHIALEKVPAPKFSKKEIQKCLELIIQDPDASEELKNLSVKKLYKRSKKKGAETPNWSIKLDRLFLEITVEEPQRDGVFSPIVLDLGQN